MPHTNSIKFTTWNICTDRRTEESFAEIFPEWSVNKRLAAIKKTILESESRIIHIQEARIVTTKYGEINSLSPMIEFFEDNGYNVSFQLREPLWSQSFYYITAYKADRFQLIENDSFYLTRTPDRLKGKSDTTTLEEAKERGFGEIGEISVLVTHLLDTSTGSKICTLNLHKGFALEHRKNASKLILDYVQNIDPNVKVIISGDFNSFNNWGGDEQMSILTDSGILTDISKDIILPNGKPVPNDSTFIAFPYDCIPSSGSNISIGEVNAKLANSHSKEETIQVLKSYCVSSGGQLDHILTGSNLYNSDNVMLNVTPQFSPGPNSYEEEDLNGYIFKHIEEGPAFASDHQPLTVVFNYYEDNLDL